MRALLLHYSGERVRMGEVPEPPPPGPGQVRMRMIEGGICGTDRALASSGFGHPAAGWDALILGHEALGEVDFAPPGCGLATGDLVVPLVRRNCSSGCAMCADGRRDLCLTGNYVERGIIGANGYFCEYAVDDPGDLVAVPRELAGVGVLVEPASVVEKAWDVARAHHPFGPRTALILGAGTIGILAAWWALDLGLEVTVMSREDGNSDRAGLLRRSGARYVNSLEGVKADIVMEACGDSAMAAASLAALAHCGVQVVLGARGGTVPMPYLDLILRNQTIVGCVNASRRHFCGAVDRMKRLGPERCQPLIHRFPLVAAAETIARAPSDVVKPVHVVSSR